MPKANKDEKKTDLHLINPDLIDIDDDLNGRWKPISQEAIENMAHSIHAEGQLQPVELRKDRKSGRYKAVLGITRIKAIKWGNETGLFSPPLMVKALKTVANDETSFRHNLVENLTRNSTTPMDDAYNQNRLRQQYAWSDTEIAKLYQISSARVGQLKALLELPKQQQEMVHNGSMPVSAAIMLVKSGMEEKEIPELVKSCVKDNGKVDTTLVKATLRNFSQEDLDDVEDDTDDEVEDILEPPKKSSPKKKVVKKKAAGETPKYPRTLKEIKEFWKEQTGLIDPSPAMGKFAETLVKFLEGGNRPQDMTKAFDRLYDQIKEEIEGGKE